MSSQKDVQNRISSVKNIHKITRAMEMVAASKMRRTQERMRQSRPYAEKIRQVIGHLANSNPEYRHTFMTDREVKRVGYIVVSSDKGLCGGLNINLFRALMIFLTPVLPEMSAAAGRFLGQPIRAWSDVATPLLGLPLNPYQPLATRQDPALVARLVETPGAATTAPASPPAAAAPAGGARVACRTPSARHLAAAPALHSRSSRPRRARDCAPAGSASCSSRAT